jgi:hypothetical protein
MCYIRKTYFSEHSEWLTSEELLLLFQWSQDSNPGVCLPKYSASGVHDVYSYLGAWAGVGNTGIDRAKDSAYDSA